MFYARQGYDVELFTSMYPFSSIIRSLMLMCSLTVNPKPRNKYRRYSIFQLITNIYSTVINEGKYCILKRSGSSCNNFGHITFHFSDTHVYQLSFFDFHLFFLFSILTTFSYLNLFYFYFSRFIPGVFLFNFFLFGSFSRL